MQCLNPRRRYLNKKPTLEDIFSDMTVAPIVGGNQGYSSNLMLSTSNTGFPPTGTAYLLSIFNGYIGIWKYNGSTIVSTPIKQQNASYGGVVVNSYGGSIYNTIYYSGGYLSSGNGTWIYGGTLAFVQFPHYKDAVIEELLSNLTLTRINGRDSSLQITVSTTNKSHAFILAALENKIDLRNGSDYSRIGGTTTAAASVSGSTLTLGSVYGGSIIGID